MKRVFILNPVSRPRAIAALQEAPDGYAATVGEPTRNLEQNSAQWPILQAFSDQMQWPVNGKMEWITPEEYKDILTCAFKRESVRVAMGMDGGMVMLGQRTSKFTKAQFSEWLEFLHATAVEREIDLEYAEGA